MVTHAVPFAYVAESVAQRAADALAASVTVIDENDVTVARADHDVADGHGAACGRHQALRIPIHLMGRSGHVIATGHREPIPPRLARALIDLVVTQASVVAQLPTQDDLRGKLIRDLLMGSVGDESAVMREAQVLGMDLSRPRAAMLVHASEYILAPASSPERGEETAHGRRAREVIGNVVRFFNLPNAAICTYLGDGEVAILKASSTRDLAPWSATGPAADHPVASWANLEAQKQAGRGLRNWLERQTGTSVAIGIGRYHAGLAGLARSYQDARAALSLGRRLGLTKQVYCLDELGAAAFVGISDERTKLELAVRLLSPLDPESHLLATLQAFFEEDCCPSATAKRLSIHRNTLSYRLDKVASLTGFDPRHFDDAIQIRLALLLRSVGLESAASPATP
jgi:carbohydrate diacid regulator